MIEEAEMVKLLGRPLSTAEHDNYDLYLNISQERLEQMLCIELEKQADPVTAVDRTYETRSGYRTAYVDPFTALTSVTIDGVAIDEDDYTIKQNDKFDGDWYNIIEFDTRQTGKRIVVNGAWGFETLPYDLQLLLARVFAQGSVEQTADNSVKSKSIEDFSVTFSDATSYEDFVNANSSVIAKYSQCNRGLIRHGSVHSVYPY